jgi:hypothetical protein
MCSFYARSKGSLATPSVSENMRDNRRSSPGLRARLGVPVGGRVRKSRVGKGSPPAPSVERSVQVGMDPAYLDETDRVIVNL